MSRIPMCMSLLFKESGTGADRCTVLDTTCTHTHMEAQLTANVQYILIPAPNQGMVRFSLD